MKVLFSANNRTSANGLGLLIDLITKRGVDFEPVLISSEYYFVSEDYLVLNSSDRRGFLKRLQNKNINKTHDPKANQEKGRLGSDCISDRNHNYNRGKKRLLFFVPHFIVCVCRIFKDLIYANYLLDDLRPDWVVVSDDRVGGTQLAILKKAKKNKIPIIMVSVSIQALYKKDGFGPALFDESLFVTDRLFDINKLQSKQQMLQVGNDKRVFFPAYYYFALRCFDMAPKHPWVSGANISDCVYTYSDEIKNAIIEENPEKIVVVSGLVEDDYILQTIKNKKRITQSLVDKYALPQDDKIVILSMPQMAEHNLVSWDVHIHNMDVLTKLLCREYGFVLISLHPKSRKQDYEYLEKSNIVILDEKLRDIIVAADCFFCLSNSSTTHYAELLHIPGYDLDMEKFYGYINENAKLNELGTERRLCEGKIITKSVVDYIIDEMVKNKMKKA